MLIRFLPPLLLASLFCPVVCAADWPTYLHDNARVGATADPLPDDLQLKWVYASPAKPELSFSGPRAEPIEGKEMRHRVAYDKSSFVAVVENRLYFGSSVDHKLYCLDAASGQQLWTFFTDGPIRLSPTVWEGKVYIGSDDGFVYCLDAAQGHVIWKLRVGLTDDRLLARGQMISRWPVRTGVLIDDGVAFFGAGVFPHETVYLCAVDAASGDVIWKNDRISQEDAGRNPLSPQGYLLCSDQLLFVPSGRSLPAAFDRQTGQQVHHRTHSWRTTAGGVVGGSKAVLADGQIYASGPHHFLALDQKTGSVGHAWLTGRQLTLSGDQGFVATGSQLVAMDRPAHTAATVKRQELNLELYQLRRNRANLAAAEYQQKSNALNRQVAELSQVGTLWSVDSTADAALVLAGDKVIAGGQDQVVAYAAGSGERAWSANVEGEASGLAVSGGRLFVSTDQGKIYAFADRRAQPQLDQAVQLPARSTQPVFPLDELTPTYEAAAEQIIELSGVKRGFCLVLGSQRGRLVYELARRTQLEIYGIEADADKVATAREALDRAGLYGHRVTIVHGDPAKSPFSNYFANLVVSDTMLLTGKVPSPATEIARFVKPCGGVVCLGAAASAPADRSPRRLRRALSELNLVGPDDVTERGDFAMLRRGKLPGAGDWSHQYGTVANTSTSNDFRVKGDMSVLWYGDPGPEPMINRHEAAAAPLSTNGRMFIQGTDRILCYDAYNGVYLWEYENPGAIRTGVFNNEETSNLAASDDALFVAVDDACTELDAATGQVRRVHRTPPSKDGLPRVWGYVGYWNGTLFGTSTLRKELEESLRRRGHTVSNTTDAIFAVDVATGEQSWLYRGKNIMHVTVAVGDDRVFFVDSSISQHQREELLRQDKSELKKLPPAEAKQKEAELKELDIRLAVALDARTGKTLWSQPVDVTDCSYVGIGGGQLTLIYQDGHVLICGANANGHYWRQFLSGQFSRRRLVVLAAETGEKLWAKDANYRHRPIVVGNEIVAEPWAFDLRTGKEKLREHPLTGEQTRWQFSRPGHHCGMITATPNTLFFRSGFTGYYDMYSDSGVTHFAGQRMGCWVNAIPGNGLLMVPEASAGCVCQFSIASTVVMQPSENRDSWKIASLDGPATPIKHLAINLGAPGDRRDGFGKLWLAYPRPHTVGRLEYDFDIKPELADGGKFLSYNEESLVIENAETSWVLTSGVQGLRRCEIPLLGENDESSTYTVKLYFIHFDEAPSDKQGFEVYLQGRAVQGLSDLDPASQAGRPGRPLLAEYHGVEVQRELAIEFKPAAKHMPLLAAIEVIREE